MSNPMDLKKTEQALTKLAYFAPSKDDKELHTLVVDLEDAKRALAAQLEAIIKWHEVQKKSSEDAIAFLKENGERTVWNESQVAQLEDSLEWLKESLKELNNQ